LKPEIVSETTQNTNIFKSGVYSVTVTDALDCDYVASVNIGLVGSIRASIVQDNGVRCYGSNEADLEAFSANGTTPLSYMWSNGNNTQFNSDVVAGDYELTIIDAWGCTGTDNHSVADGAEIVVTPSITSAGCHGGATGSISISISGGRAPYNIIWSTGATTAAISNLNTGNYSVTVTDSNNCPALGTYFVGNPENPLNVNLAKKDVSCAGGADGSILISVSGGTPAYSYDWEFNSNHFTGSSATNLSPGIYNITVADSQGCDMDTSLVIGEPQSMEYSYITINPSCIGNNDGYIEISVIGGTPPYNFAWADQTSPIEYIAGLMQGTYLFTITDNGGCKLNTEAVELVDDDTECISIPNAFTPNQDGINDTWVIDNIELFPWALIQVFNRWGQLVFEGKGGGEPWDGTWNGNIVPTGSYVYTVDLFNGTKYCGIVTVLQ